MNYTELVSELQEWTEDDSTEYQTAIPQIIRLAENRVFRDIPQFSSSRLKTTGVTATASISLAGLSVMWEIRAFSYTASVSETFLQKRTDTYAVDYQPDPSATGTPKFYVQEDHQTLRMVPAASASVQWTLYYRGVAETQRLSATNANSNLGDKYEDLILASALLSASTFLHDTEAMTVHQAQYNAVKEQVALEVASHYSSEYGRGMR